MIQCQNVYKSFNRKTVINGINLEISDGQIFGLLGPSGAGKTTLIKILTDQLSYDSGFVNILNKSVEKLTGEDKKKIGENMAFVDITKETAIVVIVNVIILIGLYGITYKRKGLEQMKIEIDIDERYSDIEVEIKAPKLTQDIEKLISLMRMINMQIAVKKDAETYLLDTEKILYIQAVERSTFVYTEDETYESDLKLYEMEQQLLEQNFSRISKQSIINLKKVKSLKADINRKIRVTLVNGEQIIVSRMYSDELRKRLGIK